MGDQATLVFQSAGEGGIEVQYDDALLNTAMQIDGNLLMPPAPNYMNFTSGAATLLANKIFTATGSGAKIRVIAVVVTVGVLTGAGQGVIFFEYVSGYPILAGDTFASWTMQGMPQQVPMQPAKSISFSVESNTIRFTTSGVLPTNAAGTPANFGQPVTSGQSASMLGWSTVKKFYMINAASGSLALVNMVIQF